MGDSSERRVAPIRDPDLLDDQDVSKEMAFSEERQLDDDIWSTEGQYHVQVPK